MTWEQTPDGYLTALIGGYKVVVSAPNGCGNPNWKWNVQGEARGEAPDEGTAKKAAARALVETIRRHIGHARQLKKS